MNRSRILEGNYLHPAGRWAFGRVHLRGGRVAEVEELGPARSEATPSAEPDGARTPPRLDFDRPLTQLPGEAFLIPGFVDAHTHLLSEGLAPLKPDLSAARDREDALSLLADWLADHPGDRPVIGEGWDQSLWPDPAFLTRAELDRVAGRRPVALRRVCGHVAVLNSAALTLVGGEWADLDAESGVAYESLPLSLARIWPPTDEERDRAVQVGQQLAWRHGVTGIHEMALPPTYEAYRRACDAGRLHLRVTHFIGVGGLDWLVGLDRKRLEQEERLRPGGLKLFLDGSIGGRSAAVRTPYAPGAGKAGGAREPMNETAPAGDSEGRGLLLWENGALAAVLRRAIEAGLQPAMHAIGDRAIEQAISVIEQLRRDGRTPPAPGPRLEHAEMLDQELLDRAVAAGFVFSMQPNFTARWQHPGGLYESVLGKEGALRLNPYQSVRQVGRLAFGSDTMPLNPLLGLSGAVGHPDPGEGLTLLQAIECYTSGGARAVCAPFHATGIEPGRWADLTILWLPDGVWPASHGKRPPSPEARVLATWFEGDLRYSGVA